MATNPLQGVYGPIDIQQAPPRLPVPMSCRIELATGKNKDFEGAAPYNQCDFIGTISVDVLEDGSVKSWALYSVDYSIACSRDGVLSGTESNKPWVTKDLNVKIGGTDVAIKIEITDPAITATSSGRSLIALTGVTICCSYQLNGALIVHVPKSFYLENVFVSRPKR